MRARLGLLAQLQWPAACVYDSCPPSSPWPCAPLVVLKAAKESCSSWATSSSRRTVGSVSSLVVSTSTVNSYCREQRLSRHCHLHQVFPISPHKTKISSESQFLLEQYHHQTTIFIHNHTTILKKTNLKMSDEQTKSMSKPEFKEIVKKFTNNWNSKLV